VLRGIDHLVVVVPDLDAAAASYGELGFTAVPGGRHPVGTHNVLIAFLDGSYLELIAFYEMNAEHRWWEPLQCGGGLVDFCMQTDDLPADLGVLRGAGVHIDDPTPLTRKRPDGYDVRWRLSIPRRGHRGVAPFLIEDETPRGERVPRETRHDNGVTGIGTVTVAVNDVPTVRHWYAAVLGQAGEDVERADLAGTGVRFTMGPHTLDVVAPAAPASPLRAWLHDRGPSPYAATLRAARPASAVLDPTKTFGARLTIV
jgi:catechol 2,3-dioxygenase-like lactoylglutathione lyase family enzyme